MNIPGTAPYTAALWNDRTSCCNAGVVGQKGIDTEPSSQSVKRQHGGHPSMKIQEDEDSQLELLMDSYLPQMFQMLFGRTCSSLLPDQVSMKCMLPANHLD